MNSPISEELIKEQNAIVNSNDKKIIISAGPGSGKTFTIIKKANKELKEFKLSKKNRGIILCSFTRESSLELKKSLSKEVKNNFSFVGTIDSFIFKSLIDPFKNRILEKIRPNSQLIKDKIKIILPTFDATSEVNRLTRNVINESMDSRVSEYYSNWINDLIAGKYEMSFASYLFAEEAIKKVSQLKKYCKTKYNSIYIDEAQDLNYFQIQFIKQFVESTNVNCYLIGDKRQSIYSFRGAKPELFYSMLNEGFSELKITHSVRCHYNILTFAKKIVGEESNPSKIEHLKKVIINFSIIDKINVLKKINHNYFILVETNKEAAEIYEKCINNGITNIIYSQKIDLKINKEFSDNYYDVIEEILKFFFNHNNKKPKLTYSVEEFIVFLESIIDITKLNRKDLFIKKKESFVDYLKKIFLLAKIQIPQNILSEIEKQLKQEIYKNQYIKYENINRIMTIHSSKGLEAEYVFLQLRRTWHNVDDEKKRKLFVACSRAKARLLIGFNGTSKSPVEEYINSIFESTFYEKKQD